MTIVDKLKAFFAGAPVRTQAARKGGTAVGPIRIGDGLADADPYPVLSDKRSRRNSIL